MVSVCLNLDPLLKNSGPEILGFDFSGILLNLFSLISEMITEKSRYEMPISVFLFSLHLATSVPHPKDKEHI